ncbi:MAG TPA: PD-(D/E)XK nuclease family protein, partial [Elusimicrobiales bacterium]|nr:PD-(D/E)XK nuclease family protein [Elusimicrobiales bacterium]
FSYSKMNTYKECPQKYKFRYVDRIKEKPKFYFAFGHSIHSSLEFLYNVKSPPFPTLNEVLKAFETDWKSTTYNAKGYPNSERHEADFQKGLDILAKYYKKHENTLHVPLSVEFRSRLAIDGLNVTIVVDRIDYLGDGKIAIVDYKTGKSIVNNTDQLLMYQNILEKTPSLKEMITAKYGDFISKLQVDKSTFYYVNSLTEKEHDRADKKQINAFWKEVLEVAESIRDGKFTPVPCEKSCRYCDYKSMCPAFNDSLQFKGDDTQIVCDELMVDSKKDTLTCKIDKYGKLTEQFAKLSKEADLLKKEIVFLMNEKKLSKHFTKNYQIELAQNVSTHITDSKKLVELLKELDLINKVLVPTKSGVEKLLADKNVSQDAKNKIKKFLKTSENFNLECKKIEE